MAAEHARPSAALCVALLATVLLPLVTACGDDETRPSIEVTQAWARPTTPGQSAGVAYMTITNDGAIDRLVGVTSDVAGEATLHLSETVDGIARMRPMAALAIPEGTPVQLRPGGLHVMLGDLARPLERGDSFMVRLAFEKTGPVDVEVVVQAGGEWELRPEDAGAPVPTPTTHPDDD